MTLAAEGKFSKPKRRAFTKAEYWRLRELGFFTNQRVYLFRGEIIETPVIGNPHAMCLWRLTTILCRVYAPRFAVRPQSPFDAPGDSVPEPDFAVVTLEDVERVPHPNRAILLIEISDSSLELDRKKATLYAAAGVPEYWIVDLQNKLVEVRREPIRAETGWRFGIIRTYSFGQSILMPESDGTFVEVNEFLISAIQ